MAKHEMAKATQRFDAVLQLPVNDALRATWAAYMLGRIYALAGDSDKASAAFQLTRALGSKIAFGLDRSADSLLTPIQCQFMQPLKFRAQMKFLVGTGVLCARSAPEKAFLRWILPL